MRFTNFKTIKLATPPGTGNNPPNGAVYEWFTLDGSNNLVINYRLADGTNKTFTGGGSSGMTNPMTAAGDIIYGGTSGAAVRLPKGTAGQVLKMNAGATAPEWVTETIASSDTTSYGNPGGCGSRNSFVIATTNINSGDYNVSLLINGDTASGPEWAGNTAGAYLRFQFESPVVINEITFTQSMAENHGIWKVQGSNNGISWGDISSSFTLGNGAEFSRITTISGNTTRYMYYQLLGISGTLSGAGYEHEIEFKISR